MEQESARLVGDALEKLAADNEEYGKSFGFMFGAMIASHNMTYRTLARRMSNLGLDRLPEYYADLVLGKAQAPYPFIVSWICGIFCMPFHQTEMIVLAAERERAEFATNGGPLSAYKGISW